MAQMSDETKINPGHSAVRLVLRTAGPLVAAIGLVLVVVGMVSFFAAFGTFEPPRYVWTLFLGIPMLFVGTAALDRPSRRLTCRVHVKPLAE